jgi:hypothetical protein
MNHNCPNCGHSSDVKHPALVSSGKSRAAKITTAQRKAWGAKGGKAQRLKTSIGKDIERDGLELKITRVDIEILRRKDGIQLRRVRTLES